MSERREVISPFLYGPNQGLRVFEVDHHAPRENWEVRVGRWPFTRMETLKAYEVEWDGVKIGDVFNIPVRAKNGTITLDYSARFYRPDLPNAAYIGGLKSRHAAIQHILDVFARETELAEA